MSLSSSSSCRRGRVKDAATAAAATTANVVAEHDKDDDNDDDGGVWVGVDFGTTHCSVAVWDSTRGFPKWMRLGQHGLAATATDSAKVGRLVPSQVLLRRQQQQTQIDNQDTSGDNDDDVWQDVSDLVHARNSLMNDETISKGESAQHYHDELQAAMGAAATRLVDQAWQQQQQEESWKNKSTADSSAASTCAASAAAVSQALVTSLKRQFAAATTASTTTTNVSRQQSAGHDDEHEKKDDHDDDSTTDETTTKTDLISVTPLQHGNDAAPVVASSDSRTTTMLIPPTDLVAAFLRALRLAADDYLHQGKTIRKHLQVPHRDRGKGGLGGDSGGRFQQLHCTNVVVGVPAHYSRSQRQLMVQAARQAGFTGHVSTLTESTAAAMAYYGLFYSNSGRQRRRGSGGGSSSDGRQQVPENNKDHPSQQLESPSTATQNKNINNKNDDDKQEAATNNPTATAAAVGDTGTSSLSTPTTSNDDDNKNTAILVFDMGGGTTDVTIAEFITTPTTTTATANTAVAASTKDDDEDTKSVPTKQEGESASPAAATPNNDDDENDPSKRFRVVVTQGDGRLGGDDMDEALCNVVLHKLQQQQQQQQTNQVDPSQQQQQPLSLSSSLSEYQRRSLLRQCQRAKEELCGNEDGGADTATVTIRQGQQQQQRIDLTLNDLESAIAPLLERAQTLVTTALEQYYRQQHEQQYPEDDDNEEDGTIDNNTDDKQPPPLPPMSEIILIGGATRVPAVRRMLRRLFDGQELCVSVNAMAAVAQGAAIQAAILSKHVPLHELQSALMIDTSPHAIGVLIQTKSIQKKSSEKKKNPPGGNDDNDGQGEEHFVEILPKDSALPAMGYATFQLADPNQPGVTVMAVEEISSSSSSSSATTKPFYAPLGEFTFLLHRLKESERALLLSKNGGQRSVDIGMTLKEDGAFVVSIFDENDPEHIRKKERYQRAKKTTEQQLGVSSFHKKEEELDRLSPDRAVDFEPMSTEQILLLIGCLILFGLYVAAKLVFLEDLEQTSLVE